MPYYNKPPRKPWHTSWVHKPGYVPDKMVSEKPINQRVYLSQLKLFRPRQYEYLVSLLNNRSSRNPFHTKPVDDNALMGEYTYLVRGLTRHAVKRSLLRRDPESDRRGNDRVHRKKKNVPQRRLGKYLCQNWDDE